jgi:hypothetical protein
VRGWKYDTGICVSFLLGIPDRDRRFRPQPKIGHLQAERAVTFGRNSRSPSSGISGRNAAEYSCPPPASSILGPIAAFSSNTRGGSRVPNQVPSDLCGACRVTGIPIAIMILRNSGSIPSESRRPCRRRLSDWRLNELRARWRSLII